MLLYETLIDAKPKKPKKTPNGKSTKSKSIRHFHMSLCSQSFRYLKHKSHSLSLSLYIYSPIKECQI